MKRQPHFGIDRELTKARRRTGIYQDSKSYVDWDGKEYLAGIDVSNRRRKVWLRDKGKCVQCGKYCPWLVEGQERSTFHMHHVAKVSMGMRKWDNLDNLVVLCIEDHLAKHVRVKWSQPGGSE